MAAAHARLRNVREERENFDEASNEILVHLKTKVCKPFLSPLSLLIYKYEDLSLYSSTLSLNLKHAANPFHFESNDCTKYNKKNIV